MGIERDQLLDELYQHEKIILIKEKANELFQENNLGRLETVELSKLSDMFTS